MKKSSNPNIKEQKRTRGWNYLLGDSWKGHKPPLDVLKDLATKLREWAVKDSSLRMDDFLDEENVPVSTYYNWKEECEELKEASDFALRRLASRRERLALYKTVDREIFLRTQHMYDKKWDKEVNQYYSKLKLGEEHAGEGQTRFILVHNNMRAALEGETKYISENLTPEGKEWLKEQGYDKEISEAPERPIKPFNKEEYLLKKAKRI